MPCDGHRSTYPAALDSFGADAVDDVNETVDAERMNRMNDAAVTLERHTLKIVQTGRAGVLTHPVSGSGRPALLYKPYQVTTGSTAATQTFTLSGFTAQEKAMFHGVPLHPSGSIHTQIRKVDGDLVREQSYQCHLLGALSDYTGDSGWQVAAAPLRQTNGDTTIGPGTYVVTVMITT
jgi:hypothetical protein